MDQMKIIQDEHLNNRLVFTCESSVSMFFNLHQFTFTFFLPLSSVYEFAAVRDSR